MGAINELRTGGEAIASANTEGIEEGEGEGVEGVEEVSMAAERTSVSSELRA